MHTARTLQAPCAPHTARTYCRQHAHCTHLHVVRLAEEKHGLAAATEAERLHAGPALARLPAPHEQPLLRGRRAWLGLGFRVRVLAKGYGWVRVKG